MFLDLAALELTEKRVYLVRHYIVTGNNPAANRVSGVPFRFSVVCRGVERAIELTKAQHPEAIIFSIADQGHVDKVDS